MTTWILVANASTAHLYQVPHLHTLTLDKPDLTKLDSFEHAQSRFKDEDLASDRLGNFHHTGAGQGAYAEATAPKEHEAEIFAKELMQALEKGRVSNQFKELVLIAPPHFLGLLKKASDLPLHKLITKQIEKDYTNDPEKTLLQHLKHYFV